MNLAEVLNLYQSQGCADKSPRTLRTDAAGLRAVAEALGSYRIDTRAASGALRGADVTRYREQRKAAGVSPTTIHRELAVASAACRWAMYEQNLDVLNPFAGRLISKADRKSIKPIMRVVTDHEYRLLVIAAAAPMNDIITFAWETGFRRDEIRLLTRDRIDGALVQFAPENQKSRRHGVRAMNDAAIEIVARQERGNFVFGVMNEARFNYLFSCAKKRAGVECKFHDIRKTWAVRARDAGVSLSDIQSQLGHESIQITESVYARPGPASAMRAVSMGRTK